MDLLPLYRDMAASGEQFRGLSILQHKALIGKLVKRYGAKTLLDFGCGAGDAYKQPHHVNREWGLKRYAVDLYDPSFPSHDVLRDRHYDGVLCSDVLEHVAEEGLDKLLGDIFSRATKFVWLSVCTREAKKTFPGTDINLHCTLHPFEWWDAKVQAVSEHYGVPAHLTETP